MVLGSSLAPCGTLLYLDGQIKEEKGCLRGPHAGFGSGLSGFRFLFVSAHYAARPCDPPLTFAYVVGSIYRGLGLQSADAAPHSWGQMTSGSPRGRACNWILCNGSLASQHLGLGPLGEGVPGPAPPTKN